MVHQMSSDYVPRPSDYIQRPSENLYQQVSEEMPLPVDSSNEMAFQENLNEAAEIAARNAQKADQELLSPVELSDSFANEELANPYQDKPDYSGPSKLKTTERNPLTMCESTIQHDSNPRNAPWQPGMEFEEPDSGAYPTEEYK